MDLENIKRGLRAEIKKRENEQYFTFQCNVRQMCKDVLAKLEEQESVIADKDAEIVELKEQVHDYALGLYVMQAKAEKEACHQKYKRCLAMARRCHNESLWWYSKGYGFEKYDKFWEKWEKRWLKIAEKFKEAK